MIKFINYVSNKLFSFVKCFLWFVILSRFPKYTWLLLVTCKKEDMKVFLKINLEIASNPLPMNSEGALYFNNHIGVRASFTI